MVDVKTPLTSTPAVYDVYTDQYGTKYKVLRQSGPVRGAEDPRRGDYTRGEASQRLQYVGELQQQQQQQASPATTIQAGLSAAGLTTGHMGLMKGQIGLPGDLSGLLDSRQQPGDADLFSSLCKLGDATRKKRSGHWIRPDYHIPQDKLYSEMSYRELIYGMCCVQNRLMIADIPQWSAKEYGDHMRFIALKGLSAAFTSSALAKYEHDLTSKVMCGDLEGFQAAEHEAVYTHLGAENLSVVAELRAEITKLKASSQRQGARSSQKGGGQGQVRCPEDICASFNFTYCGYNPCYKYHVCAVCRGNHKAKGGCKAGQTQQGSNHSSGPPPVTPPQQGQRPAHPPQYGQQRPA